MLNDAVLGEKKNMALPGQVLDLPTVVGKDEDDIINFGLKYEVDMIALSFTRYGQDITGLRKLMGEKGRHIAIIPKIENHEGVFNLHEVARECDGLMVARGDLGMEIPLQKTILAQKYLLRTCLDLAKFTITATQMMDSMEKKPRPTRAETSDITNAVLDLTDATMLSGETTTGQYPIECVKYMNWIAQEAQSILDYQFVFEQRVAAADLTDSCELQVVKAVKKSFTENSQFIVCRTANGLLPKLIAKWRPACHIYAACETDRVARSLTPVYAVRPFVANGSDAEVFAAAQKLAS